MSDFVPYTIGSELTTAQHAAVTGILVTASSLSMLCSVRVIQFSRKRWKSPQDGMYYRLMSGLSLSDVFFSLSVLCTPFLIVADAVAWHWAFGNTPTCSLTGFVLQMFGLCTTYYNCLLSFSFLAKVRLQWTPKRMQCVEWMGTGLAWIIPLASILPIVISGSINPCPLTRTCCTAPYPPGCSFENGTCERGKGYEKYRLVWNVSLATVGGLCVIFTALVYCYCRKQLRANRRYDFDQNLSRERNNLLKTVAFRALFYTLAYLNTVIWPLLFAIFAGNYAASLELADYANGIPPMPTWLYVFNITSNIFYPSQGCINYLIYTRHDIRELHAKKYPDESYLQVFWRVWKGETILQHQRESFSAPGANGSASATTRYRGRGRSSTKNSASLGLEEAPTSTTSNVAHPAVE